MILKYKKNILGEVNKVSVKDYKKCGYNSEHQWGSRFKRLSWW